jgi:tyrosinase
MMDRRTFVAGTAVALATPLFTTTSYGATPRLRRDVQSLAASDPFFSKYGQAVKKMHDLPGSDPRNWRNQALIHINHCPHGTRSFVHWHRHYILNFELICGEMIGDADFALPYWNWSAKNGTIPDPFFDVSELNVQTLNDPSNAQSDNWGPDKVVTIGMRGLSKGQGLQDDPDAGQFFTQDFIDGIKQSTRFPIFTGQLEQSPHNNGHVISGTPNGHMIDGMSPLDPIFWLHHCNIDRIWAEWQKAGNKTPSFNLKYNNQFVNGKGDPVMASSASALNFEAMNYSYDTLTGPLVAQQAEQLGLPVSAKTAAVQLPAAASADPKVLGTSVAAATIKPATVTTLSLAAKDLRPSLFKERSFLATNALSVQRVATGTGKIFAKLSDVTPPKGPTPLICKVFVNRPNLQPDTKASDPLCAGSFSFFGTHGGTHAQELYVDVTGPLHVLFRNGAIDPAKVNIQLVAVGVRGAATDASFKIGKVELIST